MGLRLRGFHKDAKSRLWLSPPGSGLNFCKQRLKYGHQIFFSLQNLKYLKTKKKYIGHHDKLIFRHIYAVTRLSIE